MRKAWWGIAGAGMALGFLLGWVARGWTEQAATKREVVTQLDVEPGTEPDEPVIDGRALLEPDELEQLLAQARAAAARTPLDRAALETLARIEDEIHASFEVAYRTWDRNKKDAALGARKQAHQDLYKAILQLSDDAVERFFTPEVVEGLPWRDLLDDPRAWKTDEVPGFEARIEDGVLRLVGPDPSASAQGIVSIGGEEGWRDFELEMDFNIHAGNCELFFRLPPVWQKNVESRELTTDDEYLEVGRSYTYLFRVVGSTLFEEEKGEDSVGPILDPITWTQIRVGAFGIGVPAGAEIEFTRLRARIYR